jgi:hypothetical protein
MVISNLFYTFGHYSFAGGFAALKCRLKKYNYNIETTINEVVFIPKV